MKSMIAKQKSWYKEIWTLDIKNQSWTEETVKQVDFLIKTLHLQGNEKILDLACGFGRHSLEFARRGYTVVGVDITKVYVEDAQQVAQRNMCVKQVYGKFDGTPGNTNEIQMIVVSEKQP